MSDDRGPGAGNIIAGIFLVLFGLCVTLLGGGCTLMFVFSVPSMTGSAMYEVWPLMLISVIVLGAGLVLIWLGVKIMTGGFNRP